MQNQLFNLILGSSNIGLELSASIVDISNNLVESGITSNFYEFGNGIYSWNYSFNDNFQGFIQFFESGNNTILTSSSVNTFPNSYELYLSGIFQNPINANLTKWKGSTPGNLDGNGFVPANTAAINGNTGRVSTFANALDNNYIEKILNLSNSGLLIDIYMSGLLSNIQNYNSSFDQYISGQTNLLLNNNVIIAPLSATTPIRVTGTNLSYYLGEIKNTNISLYDSGNNPVDLTGKDLGIVIDFLNGTDKLLITDIDIDENQFSFTNTLEITSEIGQYSWSLRDYSNGEEVLARGKINIEDAAYVER